MKKIVRVTIVIVSFLFGVNLFAQVIDVQPGYGTLNDAITANGGDKIYKLKAGGWYGLNSIIENTVPITIIGEHPAAGQMPAIIQTGSASDGTVFTAMFLASANLTIKNVFLVNADLDNAIGHSVFMIEKNHTRVVLDSVTIDPVGGGTIGWSEADTAEIFLTNSLLMSHGLQNLNFFYWLFGNNAAMDTLYVENNTFVGVGAIWLGATAFQRGVIGFPQDNFLWFNHNTMLFGQYDGFNNFYSKSEFFTNNLLWQFGYLPYTNSPMNWILNYGEVGPQNASTCLVKADMLPDETLPSQRKIFAEYNYNYRDPRINDIIKLGLDSGRVSYLLPIVTPASQSYSSREARLFSNKTDYPNFKAGHNIEDQPNTDPIFTNQKIYSRMDSILTWTKYACEQFWGFPIDSYPTGDKWPEIFYKVDPDFGNPVTWPRFDGTYSNPLLLTASIEGLPLGDLNWYPDKKAIWQQNQATFMAHILSENESQITSVNQKDDQIPVQFALTQNYPNPFNPTTQINYSVPQNDFVSLKVYNVLGQEAATLFSGVQHAGNYVATFDGSKFASGVYFYKLHQGVNSTTKEMLLLK